ncbi:uncharacterized protein LOC104452020 [Eucalyptus grandis]|uniref:uncharacterized protein LOC104452020 n=1 Tax=Eucalyptus grandis TaxID=71139 RepID=UPI00192EFE62|nr:uncharacterized protein LOC104452020 [Eucalyptus grandis]
MLAVATWLRARHRSGRCLLLALCSPVLVPLLCATFPLLCAAELCLRLCCRKRRSGDEGCGGGEEGEDEEEEAAERLRRCEEGRCGGGGGGGGESEVGALLQRYLEDQLRLVGSVYECGDDGDGDGDGRRRGCRVSRELSESSARLSLIGRWDLIRWGFSFSFSFNFFSGNFDFAPFGHGIFTFVHDDEIANQQRGNREKKRDCPLNNLPLPCSISLLSLFYRLDVKCSVPPFFNFSLGVSLSFSLSLSLSLSAKSKAKLAIFHCGILALFSRSLRIA